MLENKQTAVMALSFEEDETTYFPSKSYFIFWVTDTQEDNNTRCTYMQRRPCDQHVHIKFISKFGSDMVCLKKREQTLFIIFVSTFCYCCLRGSRVSLLSQAFIFSEDISCSVINFGMEICLRGLLFLMLEHSHKKPRGNVQFLNLDALCRQVSPEIVWQILQRVVLFSGGKNIAISRQVEHAFVEWIFVTRRVASRFAILIYGVFPPEAAVGQSKQ